MEHWYFTHYLRLDSPEVEPEIQESHENDLLRSDSGDGKGGEQHSAGEGAERGCGLSWSQLEPHGELRSLVPPRDKGPGPLDHPPPPPRPFHGSHLAEANSLEKRQL